MIAIATRLPKQLVAFYHQMRGQDSAVKIDADVFAQIQQSHRQSHMLKHIQAWSLVPDVLPSGKLEQIGGLRMEYHRVTTVQ